MAEKTYTITTPIAGKRNIESIVRPPETSASDIATQSLKKQNSLGDLGSAAEVSTSKSLTTLHQCKSEYISQIGQAAVTTRDI